MARQDFFVGTKHLGFRLIPDTRIIPGLEVRWHHSYVYFCCRCGEIWGRLLHEKATYYQCTYRKCARHGGGHLSDNYEYGEPVYWERNWPASATKYEFERFLERAEREMK